MPVPLPVVFGFEAAGTVTAVGEGADPALVGRRVVVMSFTGGSYAEYVAVPAETATLIPGALSAAEAVAVAVQAAVALSLLRAARLTGGESVLIEVASGGVGGYLTQLARDYGAGRVVATAGGPAKRERALEQGADAVLDHTDPGWPDEVREALAGSDLDVVFESIGGASAKRLLDVLTPGSGRIMFYGVLDGEPALTPSDLLYRGLTLVGCGGLTAWGERVRAARAEVLDLAARGRIRPLLDRTLPLADAAEAHRRIEDRAALGKIILVP
jgi:NADPH:quinone reductase-like Zn-dependent oxidoreductase